MVLRTLPQRSGSQEAVNGTSASVLYTLGFPPVPPLAVPVAPTLFLRGAGAWERRKDGAVLRGGWSCERAWGTGVRGSTKCSKDWCVFWVLLLCGSSRAL